MFYEIACLNSYNAGIDFSRQNLVRRRQILTTKVDPCTVRINIFLMAVDPYYRYQMNQKELTKTFIMISN